VNAQPQSNGNKALCRSAIKIADVDDNDQEAMAVPPDFAVE
jgi:hypothetical protein